MYNSKTLANNIRNARLYRNYSQDYLAFKLGMSQNGYSKIELGYTAPSVEKLMIIADTLEIDLMKLISEPDISADIAAVSCIPIGPQLLDIICRTTGMGFAAIARVTEDRWVCCTVLDKIAFGLKTGDELKLETTICNEIRQSGKAVIIDHVSKDKGFSNHPTPALYGFQSYISVPIFRQDGTFFGTLCAIDPRPAKINTPETVGLFELFAQLISFHLDGVERSAFSREKYLDGEKRQALEKELTAIFGDNLPATFRSVLTASLQVVNS